MVRLCRLKYKNFYHPRDKFIKRAYAKLAGFEQYERMQILIRKLPNKNRLFLWGAYIHHSNLTNEQIKTMLADLFFEIRVQLVRSIPFERLSKIDIVNLFSDRSGRARYAIMKKVPLDDSENIGVI